MQNLIHLSLRFQYLSKKLGADPVVFGYLQTTFAVVQLCGGPIFGRFGDIFGSRAALVLAFAAAAMSYSILGLASTVSMLFLSRLPSVFMHAMQGSYNCTAMCLVLIIVNFVFCRNYNIITASRSHIKVYRTGI